MECLLKNKLKEGHEKSYPSMHFITLSDFLRAESRSKTAIQDDVA